MYKRLLDKALNIWAPVQSAASVSLGGDEPSRSSLVLYILYSRCVCVCVSVMGGGAGQAPDCFSPPGSHLVVTNCSAEHSHPALSCKMAAEFDAFLVSGLR